MRLGASLAMLVLVACGRTEVFDRAGDPSGGTAMPMTTRIETGSQWRVTGTAPSSSDWNMLTSFDDSAWRVAPVIVREADTPDLTGDSIWDVGPTIRDGSRQVWMRRVFSLRGTIDSARLECGCNDDMEVWLNGTRVVSEADGVTTRTVVADLGRLLKVGQNLIAATCIDRIPPEHAFWGVLIVNTH